MVSCDTQLFVEATTTLQTNPNSKQIAPANSIALVVIVDALHHGRTCCDKMGRTYANDTSDLPTI